MNVVGIDVGTTNTKVGVFDLDGSRRAWTTRATPPGADELAATVLDAVRHCVAGLPEPPQAVGVTGMAETGVALDAAGRPATPLIFWTDPRGATEAEQLNRMCGPAELYRTTGRSATTKSPLAKWLWLRHNEPAVLDDMAVWLGAPDLAVRALTGTSATHPSLASRTLAFDLAAGDYDADLLALVGLRPDQLPTLTGFDGRAGTVTAAAAAGTGLAPGIPVINAGHDHTVGAWTAGARQPGTACLSLGTAEAVLLPTTGHRVLDTARHFGFTTDYSADGTRTCLVGGLPTCGALIDWMLGLIGTDVGLADTAHLPTGIVVLPYPRGRAAPAPDPHARLAIHGLTGSHGRADLLAAAIEGTCLHGRWMTETAADIAGLRLDRVVITGGQTAIPAWRRIKAALTPVPTLATRTPDAVCQGAALRAASTLGMAAEPPAAPTDLIAVDAGLRAAYQRLYEQFRNLAGTGDVPGLVASP